MSKATTRDIKGLHPRNIHKHGYNYPSLIQTYPALASFITRTPDDNLTIDFANSSAVKALNTALLLHYYQIKEWDIPDGALCPPIPGRVDYIHYIADLLRVETTNNATPIRMLDIGTGANGIYALLASQHYGWHCVASDINSKSIDNVALILSYNPGLKKQVILRTQTNQHQIFKGIIQQDEYFDISVCNPPFHSSEQEAIKANQRKSNNLAGRSKSHQSSPELNFGGQAAELWCNGGEQLFLKKMIKESKAFSKQCRWFTSLVSKKDHVKPAMKLIKKLGATNIEQIEMAQGNKITRILAWTYTQ